MAENPLKYSDFIKADNSVSDLINQLEKLQSVYTDLLSKVKAEAEKLEKSLKSTNLATDEGRDSTKQAADEADKLAAEYRKLNKAQSDTAKKIAELKLEQQKQIQVNKLQAKINVSLDGSYDKLSAQYALNKIKLNAMSKAEREGTDSGKELEAQTVALGEELKVLSKTSKKAKEDQNELGDSQEMNAEEVAKLKAEQQKQNNITKLQSKLNASAEGSYDRLSAQYSLNKIELNAMSKAERSNTKAGRELEAQTKEIYEEMKRLQEATGKHTLSVGDYEKGWRGLLGRLGEVPGATGQAASGFSGMSDAAKGFLANPLVLIISLIVGGLAALFSMFRKTQAGSDLLAKSSAALSGIFSALVGVSDKLFKGLMQVFENPQQAMKDFWEALKENVVNRLAGLPLMLKSVGNAFKALADRDLDAAAEAAKSAGRAYLQMMTGLDSEQQEQFAQAVKDTTTAINEQAKAFYELETARQRVRRANREIEKSIEEIITQEELQKAIADDSTKSFLERETAAAEAAKLTIERAKLQQRIASDNLALINREVDLRKQSGENVEDLLDQQLESYKALKQAQRDYLLSVRDNEKIQSELVQDRLERDLDILIDGFDNQKAINERIIADDSRPLEERQKKLEETRALFENSFAKQIETIQKFTNTQINSNDLINESDAVVLNQKIRSLGLSEVIEGRLLEIVRERRTWTQDLADVEKDLNAKRSEANKKSEEEAKKTAQAELNAAKESIDQQYDLRISEIDVLKATEAEKTKLRLQAEKERLQKVLALNEKSEDQLSSLQVEAIKNTIKKIDGEISKAGTQNLDIYSAFGIKLEDDQKQAISDSINFAIDGINSLLEARIAAIDKSLEKIQAEGDAIKSRLDQEIEARNNGYANQVSQVQKELELNKRKEEQALKDKEKAQKAQAAIDTLSQVSGLITASVNIWSSLSAIPVIGPALAAVAVGVMFASYAASKLKAKSVAKETYGEGGYEILQGGSHASGNDIPLGMTKKGKQRTAEGGEALMIVNKKSTKKYRGIIPDLVKSLNQGTFEKSFGKAVTTEDGNQIWNAYYDSPDLKKLESEVSEIRRQGERQRYTDSQGRLVEVYKNVKRIYV